ncbi:MAG: thermonuclease family protein [Gammaproteobacteria bacterium]|nr:thermonuclease family protein [Gammaproteobacteria bacterium]
MLLLSPSLQAAELAGRVLNVPSGEQIELLGEQARFFVQLQGIELIEAKPRLRKAAQDRLKGLIAGRFVQVSIDGERRNGQLLGFVNWGGQEVNLTLVADGLALVRPEQLDDARLRLYQAAEAQAKQQRLGVWFEPAKPARSLLPH